MVTLFGKLALVGALALGTYFGDSIGAPTSPAGCPYRNAFDCCVYYCMRDSSTGCQGGSSCCQNLCR